MNDTLTQGWVRLVSGDRGGLVLDVPLGPWRLHAEGRAVFFLWVVVGVLALAGIAVLLSGQAEFRRRWMTWALVAPVVGIQLWLGPGPRRCWPRCSPCRASGSTRRSSGFRRSSA